MSALANPRSLWEIGEDFKRWHEMLDATGGEIDPSEEQAIAEWYQSLELEEATKAGNWVGYLNFLTAEAEGAKQWADFFSRKYRQRVDRIAQMKDSMLRYLADQGKASINTDRGVKIAIRKNSAKPLLVNGHRLEEITISKCGTGYLAQAGDAEPVAVDEIFIRAKYELNMDLVKSSLKENTAPPVFEYGVAGSHIRIV